MTAKLLFFYDFARAGLALRAPANAYSRNAGGHPLSRTPAPARYMPRLRPRLECRWQIDPVTGALRAHWVCPAADSGAGASAGDSIEDRRRLRPELAIAGSRGAPRLAA